MDINSIDIGVTDDYEREDDPLAVEEEENVALLDPSVIAKEEGESWGRRLYLYLVVILFTIVTTRMIIWRSR